MSTKLPLDSHEITKLTIGQFPHDCVFVIAPHPDDSVLGCGGLLKKIVDGKKDCRICIFVMTPGFEGVSSEFLSRAMHSPDIRKSLSRWLSIDASGMVTVADLAKKLSGDRTTADLLTQFTRANSASDKQKAENLLKTAIRFSESWREAEQLGLNPPDSLRFLALPHLYRRQITPVELERVAQEFETCARNARKPLLLTPHPSDPQAAHRASTEAALRALNPSLEYTVWYYQSPWHSTLPEEIDVVVSLSDDELQAKINGARQHESQTERTPYDSLVSAQARINADKLPEMLLGYGKTYHSAFGNNSEVYQMRLREFYAPDAESGRVIVYTA
ncbi:MAG: hypothetical protein GF418_09600 [Chitinivibrionales bacterium]|nr:hypothetical protein [Chitinivibrionales bacterium]MBD3395864.1 hypothetical protein [Chitinivibrionales bacterium]